MTENTPYKMTVDLNVLDHLGINLYSNIAAVLTEAVANAWDADAENVQINIDEENTIRIRDDGVGMSIEDMNKKYLTVGYRRRDEDKTSGKITAKGRPVMGRKGLGKLSLFAIADTIEVQSAKSKEKPHGLSMRVEDIRKCAKNKTSYCPVALEDEDLEITKGTSIVLKNIKRKRLGKGGHGDRTHLRY